MGGRRKTVRNLLVVLIDVARSLIFVEGSVPGPNRAIVTVRPGRRPPLADYEPPAPLPPPEDEAPAVVVTEATDAETPDETDDAAADDATPPDAAVEDGPEDSAAEDAATEDGGAQAEPDGGERGDGASG